MKAASEMLSRAATESAFCVGSNDAVTVYVGVCRVPGAHNRRFLDRWMNTTARLMFDTAVGDDTPERLIPDSVSIMAIEQVLLRCADRVNASIPDDAPPNQLGEAVQSIGRAISALSYWRTLQTRGESPRRH